MSIPSGSATIVMPLANISDGNLSHSVSMFYTGNGIKTNAPTGTLGTGWNLNAGGSIRREIRGLPDDYSDELRKGWLIDQTYATVNSFVGDSTNDVSICDDEGVTHSFLDNLGGFDHDQTILDTEPDIYSINVQGLSGKFIFTSENNITFINKTNYSTRVIKNNNGSIVGFIIVDDKGTEFTFGEPSFTNTKTIKTDSTTTLFLNKKSVIYSKLGEIESTAEWKGIDI